MTLLLTAAPTPPYDFARTRDAAQYYSVFGHVHDGGYRRLVRQGRTLALIEWRGAGTPAAPVVTAQVLAADGPVDAAALGAHCLRLLNPGCDLRPFYAAAQADPAMRATVERLYGLHSFQLDTVFESLLVTLIEQQIALKAAQAAERWLLRTYGDALTYDGVTYYACPTPERLAALTTADLTPLKITFIRMNRMLALARAVTDGTLDLEGLRDASPDAAYAALIALHGVGHWTAAWASIRAFGRYLYFGRADVALRAAAQHYVTGTRGRMDGAALDAYFGQFGDHAGLAAFYMITRWAMER